MQDSELPSTSKDSLDNGHKSKKMKQMTSSTSVPPNNCVTCGQNIIPAGQSPQMKLKPDCDNLLETPRKRKMRQNMSTCENIHQKQKKLIKCIKKKPCQHQKKIKTLEAILKELKYYNLLNEEQSTHLKNLGVTTDLIKKQTRDRLLNEYSPELRAFACTLNFYSPKAYSHVVNKFQTCLPHPRIINKLYETIDARPGFTNEALTALKNAAESTEYTLFCNLVIDEMAIKRSVEWDGRMMYGYIDICHSGKTGDFLPEAKQVFVFLVTAINAAWKIPVGYFLVDGITAEQRANLVIQCLELIEETGIKITSLTFDGSSANMSMARLLGCSFNIANLRTGFKHPTTGELIYVMPDPYHMLKLLKKAFESYGTFVDSSNRLVKWDHLKQLNDIQIKKNYHLLNKLDTRYVFYWGPTMKIRLATELFSNNVADALQLCGSHSFIKDDQGVDGTVEFLRNINTLFDCLNSKSILAQSDFKKALNPDNKTNIFEFFDRMELYLQSLKLNNNLRVVECDRKTGFVGFLVCIKSLKAMYCRYVEAENKINYLPTYKFSWNHLELMFERSCSRRWYNSNITDELFQAVYKILMVETELKEIDVSNCMSALHQINITIDSRYFDIQAVEDLHHDEQAKIEEEMCNLLEKFRRYCTDVVVFVCGYVVDALVETIKCDTCIGALVDYHKAKINRGSVKLKDISFPIYPSNDVIKICIQMEEVMRIHMLTTKNKKRTINQYTRIRLVSLALKHFIGINIFAELKQHQYEQHPIQNHLILLTRAVLWMYMKLRFKFIDVLLVDE